MATEKVELTHKNYLHFFDLPQKLNLREKYIHGILTNHHALTSTDLQRMLAIVDTQQLIKIATFTQQGLSSALNLTTEANQSLLLNHSATIDNPAIHWLAANFTINPTRRTVTYTLSDPFNEADKETYEAIIQSAIPNAQGWTISSSITTGQVNPNDRNFSGYHALHTLLQSPTFQENEKAQAYAQQDALNTNALIQNFYTQQLEQLNIPRDIYDILDTNTATRFTRPLANNANYVTINQTILSTFLENIPTQTPIHKNSINDLVVGDFIQAYQADQPIMRFPSAPTPNLDAIQYESLFQQLSQIDHLSTQPLPRMVLSQTNSQTLDGLNAFYANHSIALFKELKIDINLESLNDAEAFVSKLKFALNNLSRSHLKKLVISDEKNILSETLIQKLHAFIEARQLTVCIDLPPSWQTHALQRQLDNTIETNQRLYNQALLSGNLAAQLTEQSVSTQKQKRQRERLNLRDNVNIDIELQEGVEEEVKVESFKPKLRIGLEQENITILRLEELKQAVKSENFDSFLEVKQTVDNKDLVCQWHKIFGNITNGKLKLGQSERELLGVTPEDDGSETIGKQKVVVNQTFNGVTTQAFSKFNEYRDYFVDGINPYDLPSGFVMIVDPSHPNQQVLHYDKNATNQQTLLPKLPSPIVQKSLSMALTQELLADESVESTLRITWQNLNQQAPYSRENSENFRQSILENINIEPHPLLTRLPEELTSKLDLYNLTKIERNALLRIYDQYGVLGVEKIVATWNTLNAQQFPTIIKSVRQYESILLNETLQNAVATINGLSTEKRQWWDELYQKHTPKDDNLCDLVQSFTQFIRTIEAKNLTFSAIDNPETAFLNVHSLPMALSRIVSILEKCDPRDQHLQWRVIAHINLSAQGALYALSSTMNNVRPCGFVIPEMEVDPKFAVTPPPYDTSNDYKAIATADNTQRLKQFYRFIAHNPHRLSLSFYQTAVTKLEQARADQSLPDVVVNQLYALLLETTTGQNCRYFIKDETLARTQWQQIVDNIKAISISVPGQTSLAKEQVTKQLIELERLPALPTLDRLVRLITKPLHNVTIINASSAIARMVRLEKANALLDKLTKRHDSKIYLGMKFYSDDDFNNTYAVSTEEADRYPGGRDLFEEHLNVCVELNRYTQSHAFIPLVSTFKLTKDDAEPLASIIAHQLTKSEFEKILSDYALECLQDVETTQNLNADKLAIFLSDDLSPQLTKIKAKFQNRYCALLVQDKKTVAEQEELDELKTVIDQMVHFSPVTKQQIAFNDNHKNIIFAFSKPFIHDVLEQTFKDNFPPQYFEALKTGKASGDVAQRIDEVFKASELKQTFESIRIAYRQAQANNLIALLDTLEIILQRLDSQSEKLHLLKQLTHPKLLTAPIHEYNQLLESIAKQGHASFDYFMEIAGSKVDDNLTTKVNYFISEALPNLRNNTAKQLNEIDVASLAAPLVLAGTHDEITACIDLNPVLTNLCETIVTEGSNLSQENLQLFEHLLDELKLIDKAIIYHSELMDLENHLNWFKTHEIEKIQVKTTTQVPVKKTIKTTGVLGNVKKIFNWMAPDVNKASPVETVFEERTQITEKTEIVNKALNFEVINKALTKIRQIGQQSTTYTYAVSQTFDLINQLIADYPAAKPQLLSLVGKILSTDSTNTPYHIKTVYDDMTHLNKELLALDNQDLVISLCEHFNGKNSAFNFGQLLQILKDPTFSEFNNKTKKQVLRVICCLLNNDKPCSWDDIQSIITRCQQATDYATILQKTFKTAPFPTLAQLNNWFDNAPTDKIRWDIVGQHYTHWSKQPVAREEINGFHLNDAKKQAQLIQGIDYSDQELNAINLAVHHAQTLDTQTLLQQIKAIQSTGADNATQLTALMAELLYRTKGLPQEGLGDNRQWGRSFEINTTQYLAVHSMLKAGGHVTSQIGTGEGKSRIMMLLIACQYALGKTVDFVTADVSLATRDYLEYQAFFKALGAETNLIMANTPAQEYRIGGINFSDASNLGLLRNKARSEGLGHLVIADDPTRRALLLDEADKTFFNSSDTRLNYSAQANPAIRDMPWVYELMVEFFSIDGNEDLYHGENSDADACNQAFKNFARGKLESHQMKRLEAVSIKQLEAWQGAALTALALEYPQSFRIRSNITIVTKQGPKKVSQAKLVSGLRASDNGKLSAGVHQCLHARLNQEKRQALAAIAAGQPLSELQKVLVEERFKNPFFIDSENQIIYSSTNKAMIDDYKEGALLAVTGSSGSIKEREEAQIIHGKPNENMTFIDIPRHRGQNRVDLPVILNKDKTHQRQNILLAIRHAIQHNQPILLVCENDKESDQLHTFLKQHLTDNEKTKLKLINTDTTLDEEANHIEHHAGLAGAITVSTAMLGRGTDIKLRGEDAKQHGLCVLSTYLPRERDQLQIIGRSGRFGAKGDARFILNQEQIKKAVGISGALPCEFYTATESYLKQVQANMDVLAQKQRLIKDIVGDFRIALTTAFFDKFYSPVYNQGNNKDDLLRDWQVFIDKTDKAWNTTWPSISNLLTQEPVDKEQINGLLTQYEIVVQGAWKGMKEGLQAQIRIGILHCSEGEAFVETALKNNVGSILLTEKAQALLYDSASAAPEYKTTIAETYDKAFIGRAVLYTKWIDNIRAFIDNFKSAWRGDSPWFPNLKAAQLGHMTWRAFFFGVSSTKTVKQLDVVETTVSDSSTHIDELLPHINQVTTKSQDDSALDVSYQRLKAKKIRTKSLDDIELIEQQKNIKAMLRQESNVSNPNDYNIKPR